MVFSQEWHLEPCRNDTFSVSWLKAILALIFHSRGTHPSFTVFSGGSHSRLWLPVLEPPCFEQAAFYRWPCCQPTLPAPHKETMGNCCGKVCASTALVCGCGQEALGQTVQTCWLWISTAKSEDVRGSRYVARRGLSMGKEQFERKQKSIREERTRRVMSALLVGSKNSSHGKK